MNGKLQDLANLLLGKMPPALIEEEGAECQNRTRRFREKKYFLPLESNHDSLIFCPFTQSVSVELSNAVQENPFPGLSNFFVAI